MTYWISKATYALITAGMTPEQVAGVNAWFDVYPDPRDERLFHVDQDRIAEAYERLVAEEPLPLVPSKMAVQFGGRRNGRSHWRPPTPWYEVTPGVWMAPPGTPKPRWTDIGEVLADMVEQPDTDRYFLNDVVTATPATTWDAADANPLEDMRAWMNLRAGWEPPPPRRIKAGPDATAAIRASAKPAPHGWPKDPTGAASALAYLTGIPIVPDDDLPTDAWQLVDDQTGEVIQEGTAGTELAQYRRVLREYAEHLAEQTGLPADLIYPDYCEEPGRRAP